MATNIENAACALLRDHFDPLWQFLAIDPMN
jgi:hypothetical protein